MTRNISPIRLEDGTLQTSFVIGLPQEQREKWLADESRQWRNRRAALGRHLNCEAARDGQISLEDTPDIISYGGTEIYTVEVDEFIEHDLKLNPYYHGAAVFEFRSGRRRIFAAVVIDSVERNIGRGEVHANHWHVELYSKKAHARKCVQVVLDRIGKKCAPLELYQDGE